MSTLFLCSKDSMNGSCHFWKNHSSEEQANYLSSQFASSGRQADQNHRCEGTASEFLPFKATIFLHPAPDGRRTHRALCGLQGKAPSPLKHATTLQSGAPDTSGPSVSASAASSFRSRHPRGAARRHDWHPVGGVSVTSLAFQLMPRRVHLCRHLIIFHFHQLSGQPPDRTLNSARSQPSPTDPVSFWPSQMDGPRRKQTQG